MKSKFYVFGFIAGLVTVFIVFGIIGLVYSKKNAGKKKAQYDERQMILRKRAFKAGFIAFCLWDLLILCLSMCFDKLFLSQGVVSVIGLFFGTVTFVIVNIWSDSYFAQDEKKLPFILLMISAGCANLPIVVIKLDEGFITDGVLNINFIGCIFEAFFAVVLINVILKTVVDKIKSSKDESNEELKA